MVVGLAAVTAFSAHDIWAVGSYDAVGCCRAGTGPVIVHWNGRSWRRVPSPNIPGSARSNRGGIELSAISAVSAQDIWAVGPLRMEHWDGRNWRIVRSPQGASGVAAISSHNVWAVGSHGYETLLQHWNGIRWGIFPSPNTNI